MFSNIVNCDETGCSFQESQIMDFNFLHFISLRFDLSMSLIADDFDCHLRQTVIAASEAAYIISKYVILLTKLIRKLTLTKSCLYLFFHNCNH